MTADVRAPDGGPLRVLAVTHVFPRTEDDPNAPFLLRHVQGLMRVGVDVRVLAPHDAGLPLNHEVGGVPVRRVRYGPDHTEVIAYRGEMHHLVRRSRGAWRAVRLAAALRSAVREEVGGWRPHVLDAHWLVPAGAVVASERLAVPVQVNVHGTDLALVSGGGPAGWVGRWALRGADAVTAMSEPLAAELQRVFGRRPDSVTPMPAAPPPAEPRPAPDDGPILAVGRLVPEKGHADLVAAVARMEHPRPLVIVGDGPEHTLLSEQAHEVGVDLDLPGALPPNRLEERYEAASVVAVPSHREGFGLVAAEALQRLRPVVTTGAGGLADIVSDAAPEPTGWLVPVGDVPRLAAALDDSLTDREEAHRRARAGARHVAAQWSAEALGRQAAVRLAALARLTVR